MNPYTQLAIDAYRRQESLRRRLAAAESDTTKAARLVPAEDRREWFLWTEIIRLEEDAKVAEAAGDREGGELNREMVADLRRQLRDGPPAAPAGADRWTTWPPARDLVVGREYLVRTLTGSQKHPREMRASYLGMGGPGGDELQFNARPTAGTQSLHPGMIVATKDVGESGGRDDPARYCNKVIR